jgi:cell division septal protein FtsQ
VLVGTGLLVTAVALGGQWLLHQSVFRVQHVVLIGVHHETSSEILVASGLDEHPSMVAVSSTSLERSLSSFTWISSVSVVKHWPNSIVVTVHETSPVAVAYGSKHHLQFVNQTGRDLGPAPLNANYPTLVYLDPKSATWPFARAGRSAAWVASQLPKAFSAQVSQISVGAAGIVTLKMTSPVTFVLGPATELHAKFVAIASVIAHTTLKPGDVVDVSVPDELAVTGPAPS